MLCQIVRTLRKPSKIGIQILRWRRAGFLTLRQTLLYGPRVSCFSPSAGVPVDALRHDTIHEASNAVEMNVTIFRNLEAPCRSVDCIQVEYFAPLPLRLYEFDTLSATHMDILAPLHTKPG